MCRLFAVLSNTPVAVSYFVKEAPYSLLVQSRADKKRLQADGWGLGWYASGHPRVFKSAKPFYQDNAGIQRAVRQAKGTVLLGHVRWASNPLKLSREDLIGPAHTQPFTFKDWTFIHNGTLYIPNEVKAALGPGRKFVQGNNDSEVLFYWMLRFLPAGPLTLKGIGKIAKAVEKSILELDEIWQRCRSRYPIYKSPFQGLNWVLTNGKIMLAFCYVNAQGFGQNKALTTRNPLYFDLQMKKTDDQLVIASEPLARESGWESIGHGRLLMAERDRGHIMTQRIRVI